MTVDCGRPLASLRNDNPKFSRAVLQRTTPYGVGRCAFGGDPRTFALLYCPVFKELRRHVFVSCGSFDRVLALMCRSDADDSITRRIASQAIERSFRRPSLDESRRYVRGPTGSSAGRGRPNGSRPASRAAEHESMRRRRTCAEPMRSTGRISSGGRAIRDRRLLHIRTMHTIRGFGAAYIRDSPDARPFLLRLPSAGRARPGLGVERLDKLARPAARQVRRLDDSVVQRTGAPAFPLPRASRLFRSRLFGSLADRAAAVRLSRGPIYGRPTSGIRQLDREAPAGPPVNRYDRRTPRAFGGPVLRLRK